jgi:Holliday junction DNA helicase RuvA
VIAKLSGLVDEIGEDCAVIDVGGVGYLLFCSARTLARLPAAGQPASLFVETHVREDHIHLYGFGGADEREWFRLLTTVQGVGAKVALGVLSVLAPDQIMQAIAAQDRAALSRAPGVGPKLASRIISELKEKAGAIALGPAAIQATRGRAATDVPTATRPPAALPPAEGDRLAFDAVSALVNLGYGRSEAFAVAADVLRRLGGGADLAAVIRAALAELAPHDQGLREPRP